MAETAEVAAIAGTVDVVDPGGGVVGVVVDGVLHLAQEVVELDEVLLRPGVGHVRQIVLLHQRVRRRRRTRVHRCRGWGWSVLGHVLLRAGRRTVGDSQRVVERQQRAAD